MRSLWKQRPTEKSVLCPTRRLMWKMPFVQTKNDANGDVDEERGVEEKNAVLPNHERPAKKVYCPTNKWSFDFVGEPACTGLCGGLEVESTNNLLHFQFFQVFMFQFEFSNPLRWCRG